MMSESARSEETRSPEEEFGISVVRELLQLIKASDITELKIERGSTKFHIKRGGLVPPTGPSSAAAMPTTSSSGVNGAFHPQIAFHAAPVPTNEPENELELAPGSQVITAPMVGTFYTSSSPKDPAFISEGDSVEIGDVIGIVEAMKIMNEIDSEYAGRITKIYVSNGQPVEYGQPLMVVEPR